MQTALVLSSRGSDIPGHFRSKSDQGRLLCRAVRHGSSQPTKLSGNFGRKKCWDPYTVAYMRMEAIYPDDHFKQLPADVKCRVETYQKSMDNFEKEWESIKRGHATSQLDPQVQEKQLQLIRGMKNDLVGLLDVLEEVGFYLIDHYHNVRSLLRTLPPAESTSPKDKG